MIKSYNFKVCGSQELQNPESEPPQDGRVLTALFPIAACGSLGKCGH